MKIRAKHVAIGAVTFNVGLVCLTFGLSKHAEIKNPMEGKLIGVGEASVHVIESMPVGYELAPDFTFDAVVLVHGASTSSLDFKNNLLPELSKRHRVLAFDRPGHGYSDRGSAPDMQNPMQQADMILDSLAAMEISRPVIIGHSWAGSVVLAALLSQREDVSPSAGVLIAGVSHPYEREDSTPTKLALTPVVGPVFRWQYLTPMGRLAMQSTVDRFFKPDSVPGNYINDTGLHLSLRPKPYLYNARDRSNLSGYLVSQSDQYPQITRPILSIAASEDHVVPPSDHHDKLILALSDSSSVVIQGAGHSPHHTRTDEVVIAIETFIDDL